MDKDKLIVVNRTSVVYCIYVAWYLGPWANFLDELSMYAAVGSLFGMAGAEFQS